MSITSSNYGMTKEGQQITLYTITNDNGVVLEVSDIGAVWVSIKVPDREGRIENVNLNLKDGEEYAYRSLDAFGAPVGRNANRIDGCKFSINGKEYTLADNDKGRNLHSGPNSYYTRMWQANPVDTESGEGVEFTLHSEDGDQGMPGNLDVTITYVLTPDNSVLIEYRGVSDADTIFNLTNHAYFNLDGYGAGSIENHLMWIDADEFLYGTGNAVSDDVPYAVEGTPFDFRQLKRVGDVINCDDPMITTRGGIDHNFCLKNKGNMELVAKLVSEDSGRFMDVFTDLPGIQIYTGNYINNKNVGSNGATYDHYSGVAMETQFWPDAINHENFVSPILRAGDEFVTQTVYHFGVVGEE